MADASKFQQSEMLRSDPSMFEPTNPPPRIPNHPKIPKYLEVIESIPRPIGKAREGVDRHRRNGVADSNLSVLQMPLSIC